MKITNKENLCKYLQENLIDDERAEVFSEVIWIQSNEKFNESIRECTKECEECGDDTIVFWYDTNLYSLVEELCLMDDDAILSIFGCYYNDARIVTNEKGEGYVFQGALW